MLLHSTKQHFQASYQVLSVEIILCFLFRQYKEKHMGKIRLDKVLIQYEWN